METNIEEIEEIVNKCAVTKSTIKWFIVVFGLPILVSLGGLYRFYTAVPLIYAEQKDVTVLREGLQKELQILRNEVRLNQARYEFLQVTLDKLIADMHERLNKLSAQIENLGR